ncbi:hypothetical protein F4703DRAFT_1160632 [Phycomyces blakesleeanus]
MTISFISQNLSRNKQAEHEFPLMTHCSSSQFRTTLKRIIPDGAVGSEECSPNIHSLSSLLSSKQSDTLKATDKDCSALNKAKSNSENKADRTKTRHKRLRKQSLSLNHLINFTLTEPPVPSHIPCTSMSSQSLIPHKRDAFVNANYRFLIHPDSRDTVDVVNPDTNVDWDNVEQVVVSAANCSNCPVCLSTPSVPRMAKCGHIFCLACISQFFTVQANPYRTERGCPICMKHIERCDLRCVRIIDCFAIKSDKKMSSDDDESDQEDKQDDGQTDEEPSVKPGQTVDFCLLHRKSDYVFVQPVPEDSTNTSFRSNISKKIPFVSTKGVLEFSRYMLATRKHMEAEFEREQSTLEIEAIESLTLKDANQLGTVTKCIQEIETSNEGLSQRYSTDSNSTSMSLAKTRASWAAGYRRATANPTRPAGVGQDYYFHQAVDGQYVYLNSLNIRMLRHEFGDYCNFPKRFSLFVLYTEEATITPELRKRHKYIAHLPLYCNITFALVDLSGVVSEPTLKRFEMLDY